MKYVSIITLTVLFVLSNLSLSLSADKEFEKANDNGSESEKVIQQHQQIMKEYEKELSKLHNNHEKINEIVEKKQKELYDMHKRVEELYAQLPSVPDQPPPPFAYPNKGRGSKFRLMVMYRLVEQLNLDEDTAAKFFPAYLEYINIHDKLIKQNRELIHKIAEDVDNESVPIQDLQENNAKLRENDKLINEEKEIFHKKSEKILDKRQYIKLVIFNDKLKEDLFQRFRSDRTHRDMSNKMSEEMSRKKAEEMLDKIEKYNQDKKE